MIFLPAEIVLEIFSYLKPKDLARLMMVNRTCRTYALTDSLWTRHLNHKYPSTRRMLGSEYENYLHYKNIYTVYRLTEFRHGYHSHVGIYGSMISAEAKIAEMILLSPWYIDRPLLYAYLGQKGCNFDFRTFNEFLEKLSYNNVKLLISGLSIYGEIWTQIVTHISGFVSHLKYKDNSYNYYMKSGYTFIINKEKVKHTLMTKDNIPLTIF